MRTLIVTAFTSLDGVMEAPGGEPGYAHTGWVAPHFSDALGAYKFEEQLAADTLLLGRRTYESFAGAWPDRDGPMAEKINTMEKFVLSSTLDDARVTGDPRWVNTSVLSTIDEIAALRAGDGGSILVAGSRSMVHALFDAELVDELHLQVMPVILGSGLRLFPERAETIALHLTKAEALESGVMLQEFSVGV